MTAKPSFLASYLTPLRPLLSAPDVVEVALNPDGQVWVERHGQSHMQKCDGLRLSPADAQHLAQAIASDVGVQFSDKKPVVSGKIIDGGMPLRAQVIAAPVVEGGSAISLRRYSQQRIVLDDIGLLHGTLVDLDQRRRERAGEVVRLAASGDLKAAMRVCIEDRLNIVVSGGTSTGKTTFARSLLAL